MILGNKTCYEDSLKINLTCVQSSRDVSLLGVITDKTLTFKKYVDNFARKAQHKINTHRQSIKLCILNMDVLLCTF